MQAPEADGETARFCADRQRVSLNPRGLEAPKTAPAPPRMPRHTQVALVLVAVTVVSALAVISVVVLRSPRPEDAPSREFHLGDNYTGQFPVEPSSHLETVGGLRTQNQILRSRLDRAEAEMETLNRSLQSTCALSSQIQNLLQAGADNTSAEIQALRGHLERAGREMLALKKDLEAVAAQTRTAAGRLQQTDAQMQVLAAGLETASSVRSQLQVVGSQWANTSSELQALREGMGEVAALRSEFQTLQSDLQKVRAEVQRLQTDMETTKTLTADVQREQSCLGTLNATLASREQLGKTPGQILQLILQGWQAFGGNLYYFSQAKKSWDEAEQDCVSRGAHLASVTSPAEQAFLVRTTSTEFHWIGLTDRGSEGNWYWADGTVFSDTESKGFWDKNQPDNWRHRNGVTEDCVHVKQLWNDMNCEAAYPWVCQQPVGWAG